MTDRAFAVVRAGALTTVQDLGRPGHAHLGVPRSGALDAHSGRLVNRLAGNAESAAVLETTLNGCAVRPRCVVTVAVGGAPCPVTVDGRPVAWGAPVRVAAGSVLEIGPAVHGVRSYVAFAGGITVDPVLGSRSTDLLSGLGPAPLADGAVLPLGTPAGPPGRVDGGVPWPAPPAELVLRVRLGPRADWFTDTALRTLASAAYLVSSASNRIGLRTKGPALERAVHGELPSEGVVLGAVQVPPDGCPVVFLADHPTTGGYPVVAVVDERDLAAAAQAVPGIPVRFVLNRRTG
ncbi:biotin-dependent carboxyltransferase family protein [Streptomyces lunaelactis]|uniref:5-oxoprolinase subunit C family protein n=1 Tax=Streptomyces lunaelactis TaxID=1535768 RepID=UPI0015857D6D|nr:biotin-dependent carboxyltransferase family protein [Streptomyces lunaelactis]NUK06657.1 biotin-dependent carboxyltransferase family protein [Streptomyces lunaelactis]NUK59790.1 biotin-dependent carboxyltransferase family protein [Streptomyces lunaelactis]NUK69920.1 biotin-dependent carboxyltransferase family protein [Streptomyces lunaelactis]NUK80751.1 biotin-dependent carboxyltransferase family protein [Streptomyces lunaelactis]NUL14721.1 biotin-dependent carboxyltransferase family protei